MGDLTAASNFVVVGVDHEAHEGHVMAYGQDIVLRKSGVFVSDMVSSKCPVLLVTVIAQGIMGQSTVIAKQYYHSVNERNRRYQKYSRSSTHHNHHIFC